MECTRRLVELRSPLGGEISAIIRSRVSVCLLAGQAQGRAWPCAQPQPWSALCAQFRPALPSARAWLPGWLADAIAPCQLLKYKQDPQHPLLKYEKQPAELNEDGSRPRIVNEVSVSSGGLAAGLQQPIWHCMGVHAVGQCCCERMEPAGSKPACLPLTCPAPPACPHPRRPTGWPRLHTCRRSWRRPRAASRWQPATTVSGAGRHRDWWCAHLLACVVLLTVCAASGQQPTRMAPFTPSVSMAVPACRQPQRG